MRNMKKCLFHSSLSRKSFQIILLWNNLWTLLSCPGWTTNFLPSSIPPRPAVVHRYFCKEKRIEEIINISRTFIMANKFPECNNCCISPIGRERYFYSSDNGRENLLPRPPISSGSPLWYCLLHLSPKTCIVAYRPSPHDVVFLVNYDYYSQIIHANWPLIARDVVKLLTFVFVQGLLIRINYGGPYRIAMKKCVKLQSELFIALRNKVDAPLRWIVTFCLTISLLPLLVDVLQNFPKSRALGMLQRCATLQNA